ncbi:hypothetical protein Ctaglu_46080 [Clostridium tagluense]|uniref:Uncharacterized protein n=1 Tax=Clostridium tagluense TaxID=360422 RepID=A0A401UTW3_9CLOT|nr:hypothetical protein Ctaglu_46080 [Clostridium tagluense]
MFRLQTRLVLKQDYFIALQEYYVNVAKEKYEVGGIYNSVVLFQLTSVMRKRLSKS